MKIIRKLSIIVGLGLMIFLILYGYQAGWFSSKERLAQLILPLGVLGPLLFIFIQAIQVVVPILPGATGCAAGVWIFGITEGFLYNYIGICIGSILAFLIARIYGKEILKTVASKKIYSKYENWLDKNPKRFERLFAMAIFFPIAPDDFLCFMAGTTSISFKRYLIIILVGKPISIFLYTLFISLVCNGAFNYFA